ncbi:SMC family ATPase [Crocinitomicaceae bacterium CZZ-1]|uniref:SMC family ATPase n=1 Tax=Taishania pollutisoli TaxID=2766479 RepID=A0A8J6TXE0_9FLAO|nr:SMC family ATPase [Taishania pollutisoli]MBC9812386.1 SMC family ATPase [Taishania pollutisoli]
MIPISLTIKGLYSYQNEQVIDFKKLTDAQLFGIFGTVGSGKSSILEAISFALYGDTERLNKSGDNRNYNMLNLKSNELLIDFTFLNYDEQVYRFTVKGRRNSNNFDNVPAFTRSAYKLNNGSWEPIEPTADSIIGLSYENFRRTIIIPQGKFQEFLQLGDTARTNMLKEIFQLEKYEFYQQTASLERKNDAVMQELSGRLNQLGEVTEEAVKAKSETLKDLTGQHKTAKDELTKLEVEESEAASLKKQFDDRAEKQTILKTLLDRKPEIDQLEKQVAQYEYCLLHFKGLMDTETSVFENQTRKRGQLTVVSERLQGIQSQLSIDEPKLQTVTVDYNQLENRNKEKSEYETVLSIKEYEEKIVTERQNQKTFSDQLTPLNQDKETSEQLYNNQKATVATLKSEQPNFSELGDVQSWFVKMEGIRNQLSVVRQQLKDANELIDEKKSKLVECVPLELNARFAFSSFDSPSLFLTALENQEKSNVQTLKELQDQLNHAQVQTQLAAYTEQITDGAPCPLCGSYDHPNVLHIDAVSSDISELEVKISQHETENRQITLATQKLNVAISAITVQTDQTKRIIERIIELEGEEQQHLSHFTWSQFSSNNKEQFDTVRLEALGKQQELQQQEAALSSLEEKSVNAQKLYDATKEQVDTIETQIKILTGQVTTLKSQVQLLDASVYVMDTETIREKVVALVNHIANTTTEYNDLTKNIQQNQIALAAADTEKKGLESTIKELDQELENTQNLFTQRLTESAFSDKSEVETVLQTSMNAVDEKQKIATFNQQLFSAEKDVKALNQQLEGKTFDPIAYQTLKESLVAKKEMVETLNTSRIEIETQFNRLNADWNAKKQLQIDFKKLELRKANIQILKRLFTSSGFVSYISSVYLQQLCEAANERFHKLTRQQLRLEVTENNNFQVRDFLNEGRVRSIKTLSGGQTFQASLCLALALAESIPQQSRANQNFFFLDEGFGSQDKESLRIVFESLKALRQENRIVGVISHVEELQQEIDTYLTIANDPETGSWVMGSWE